MSAQRGPADVGSVAEEAAKLFQAVEAWARGTAGSAGAAFAAADEHVATGAAECQLCPVCQLISALRGARPEVFEHLLDAAGSLMAALRVAVDAHERSWAARRTSPVEHIDIG